jgi:protein required for attachment to host cells
MRQKRILIAHRGGARFFAYDSLKKAATLLESIPFPDGKLLTKQLKADKPGSFSGGGRPGGSAMVPQQDAVDREASKNAKRLAEYIVKKYNPVDAVDFVVAAGPQFMGKLRHQLRRLMKGIGIIFLSKDFAKVPNKEIFQQFDSL